MSQGWHGPRFVPVVTPAGDGFGAALRRVRQVSRLSQSALAEAVERDHSMIARLEMGARQPSRETVRRLCEALALPPAEARQLMHAAGFVADGPEVEHDAEGLALAALLADPAIAIETRHLARQLVGVLTALLRQRQEGGRVAEMGGAG